MEDEYVEIDELETEANEIKKEKKTETMEIPKQTIPVRLSHKGKKKGRKWSVNFADGGIKKLCTSVFGDLEDVRENWSFFFFH